MPSTTTVPRRQATRSKPATKAAGKPATKAARKPARSKATAAKPTAAKSATAKPARKAGRRSRYSARTADKYELYQKAVQSADTDIEFLARVFRSTRGRRALHFREDFCGTGLLSSHWILQGPRHTAEGFDIDPDPVAWGLAHNFEPLGEDAARYTVHLKDVRAPGHRKPDLRVAQNFSYCVFKTRRELLEYFRAARESLVDDGLFVMDLHGGTEATEEMEESRRCGGFTYVWDQDAFFPGTGEYRCHIHFRFPDGSEMKRAFTYDWRLWYLTELKDVLLDAGFQRVDTYFEGTDEDGTSGNGEFRKGLRGENCLSWISYLVGVK